MKGYLCGFLGLIMAYGAGPLHVDTNSRKINTHYYAEEASSSSTATQSHKVQFPLNIKTLGGAIRFLIGPAGIGLDEPLGRYPEQYILFFLKLPDAQRTLIYEQLEDALSRLVGKAYKHHINPVTRRISFELKPEFSKFVGESELVEAKRVWAENLKPQKTIAETLSFNMSREIVIHGYGPVKFGETLGGIVNKLDLHGLTLDQAMVRVFQDNPDAFVDSNMNQLREGALLTIMPFSKDEVSGPGDASAVVDAHYQRWLETRSAL